jgi:hypothetical protein
MAIADANRQQLEAAIAQLKADVVELEGHIPTWISENTGGTHTYRPIARRIVLSAQRVQELVRENTY